MVRRIERSASIARLLTALLASVALVAAACGGGTTTQSDAGTDGGGGESYPDVDPKGIATSIETNVVSQPTAGTPLKVDCQLLDDEGNPVSSPSEVEFRTIVSPKDSFTTNDAGKKVPTVAGDASVACFARSLSLVDETPAEITIDPGPPHTVRTSLDKQKVTAGSSAQASCSVYDEYGNAIDGANPSVGVDAMGAGISVDGKTVTIEKADIYQVTCSVNGAAEQEGAPLEVNPAKPANLTMDPVPKKNVYSIGEVIRFSTIVTDQYGNEVRDASVGFNVQPPTGQPSPKPFGRARWEFDSQGEFDVTATVQDKTKGGQQLAETETVVINGKGPAIDCRNPSNGEMLDRNTFGKLTFKGRVEDPNGVKSVEVDGNPVSTGSSGRFSTKTSVDFGVNFVDVKATDQYGAENSRTCAFLVSDEYHRGKDYVTDGVALELRQDALDDGVLNSPALNSLADVLFKVLNSSELLDDIGNALLGSNPLYQDSWAWGAVSAKASYEPQQSWDPGSGLRLGSSKVDMSLNWRNGGIDASATIGDASDGGDDFEVRLDIDGTCDDDGWLRVDEVEMSNMSIDITRTSGGNLDANLVNVNVNSGNVDFGPCGILGDGAETFFQDTFQNQIETALENQVKSTVESTLDGLFNSLDVGALSNTFQVPELDGTGSVPLDFNARFSQLGINSSRALLGIGTRFAPGKTEVALPSKGVPFPNPSTFHDPNVTTDRVGASIYIGIINQVLHALWRGGMFDTNIASSMLGSSAPNGTSAELQVGLPPVAQLQSASHVDVMIGDASLKLTYPGLFENVRFDVGLVAKTGVNLKNSDTLEFKNIQITDFYFTPRDISLDSNSRAIIESFLKKLFQNVIDRSLNSGLPALPIPSFRIDSTLSNYGLPQGQRLGLTGATLGAAAHHFTLKGNFGKK